MIEARENECQISQNYILHMKFSELYLCFHNSCEIWRSFSRTPMRNFLWCSYRRLITSLGLGKCKKEFFKLFCYKVFVPRKLKLLNFLVDSVLKRIIVTWRVPLEKEDQKFNWANKKKCYKVKDYNSSNYTAMLLLLRDDQGIHIKPVIIEHC